MATTPAKKKSRAGKSRLDAIDSPISVIEAQVVDKKKEILKGRYTKITDAQVKEILGYMEKGESERKACEHVGVNRSSFRQRLARFNVDTQYARALEVQAIAQIEAIEKTIDDMRQGTIDASMARVEIDTRKWFASKLLPRVYGDKIDLTSDGKVLPTPLLGSISIQNNS